MAFIFASSSVPGSQIPGAMWDKLAHLLVYAALGVFYMLPLSHGRLSGITGTKAGAAIVLSFLYGLSDEVHQMFTPGRTPDILDVVADTTGASLGVAAVVVLALLTRALGLTSPPRTLNREP
jgi:VanZ family protein